MHWHEVNKIRNAAKIFAHLLYTDSLDWSCLTCVKLTEEDTTSSSRIFIKILFQEIAENLGTQIFVDRLKNDSSL
jgi:pre-mRNA-splicing factor CWC22